MDAAAAALLDRARLAVAGPNEVRLSLDGWPLVAVDLAAGEVAVNDLRSRHAFAHTVAVGPLGAEEELTLGAVGEELYLLVGGAACVFVIPEPAPCSHAEVAVVASATGQVLAERRVRYRQAGAWPASAAASARRR